MWPLENMKSQVQGNYGKYVIHNFFFFVLRPKETVEITKFRQFYIAKRHQIDNFTG